jgi:hypothetical protein
MTNSDFLYRVKPKPIDIVKNSSKRARNKEDICSKLEILLKDPSKWSIIDNREQYTFIGFFHDTSKLLYLQAEIWSSFGMITICQRDRVSLRKPSALETGNTSFQEPLVMGLR